MLRVGLTGGLGSGKSTAAAMFAAHRAHVLSADEIARELMQPGQAVYANIIVHFGPSIVAADGSLDRAALARLAFVDGRVEELNAIVHPATIARQAELACALAARQPDAVLIVESALLFETKVVEGGWRSRFDKVILVTAPEEVRIARFVARVAQGNSLDADARAAIEQDARRRMLRQMRDSEKAQACDYILSNDGSLDHLQAQVDRLWPILKKDSQLDAGP